jgi:hypothetical protein
VTTAQVAALRERLYDVDTAEQVAWVDVLRDGDVVVHPAPHCMIPRGI